MKNESNVNSYSKVFPIVLKRGEGDIVTDDQGKYFVDFFSGAGTLNYGHNHPAMKSAIHSFLDSNAIVHCLDMDSEVKAEFLERFEKVILTPRGLNYKVQFSGPTGTNAVEAAVKLARIVTKRKKIVAFTHSFHGMSATSLALSGSLEENQKVNPPQDVVFFPFENFFGAEIDTIAILSKMIATKGSGLELPAAVILETVQAEGGVNVASEGWLCKLREFTQLHGILLIVDDIQVGCGRTGSFFSFERAQIIPDMVLLSKSISGFGLPLSLVLIKPELDVWKSGEHNGTFRSNNLSLCTATVALDFWADHQLEEKIKRDAENIREHLEHLLEWSPYVVAVRGIGMIWGIELVDGKVAKRVADLLFKEGMLIERCGNNDQVIKILCPLTITEENLNMGLKLLQHAILNLVPDAVTSV
ncbi:diaminobutyrate--2-oxoglutarate transaminase [Pedobacter sp. AW31-3R]|uniref:diaminobutyrate--2-oxoglutarate transaminase n=1 Tax=Pedobacter sp. AW31-3R TaxID=3445781 RepID=UPI003F9F9C54